MPKKLCGSVRWSRHRKAGVPKKLCVQQGCLCAGKMVRLSNFLAQQGGLGTGKMVRLRNFVSSKVVYAQEKWCA